MPFNGSGTFSRVYNWVTDKNNSINITASRMDTEDTGFATGLTNTICKDGQSTPTANLPMGGFAHTGVALATLATQYPRVDQVQSSAFTWIAAGGTADAITATYAPALTSLTDGLALKFRAAAANATTTPTFAPNGLTAHTITKKGGAALVAGDIPAALAECEIVYNLANTRWELMNPYIPLGSSSVFGAVKVDGTSITASGGVISAVNTGGPVLLVTNTPSAAASTSFSSTYITSTYKSYEIRMFGVFASGGAGVDLYLTASVDNGSNYLASNYAWDAGAAGTSVSDSKINITGGAGVVGTTLAACNDGIITLYNPTAASRPFSCDWKIHKNSLASIASGDIPWGAGTNSGTTAINNIKLALNGQNINGTFELWGIP